MTPLRYVATPAQAANRSHARACGDSANAAQKDVEPSMNVLQVVAAAPRTGQAQEDDPLAWIERTSAQANTELYVLLQGDAVRYALTPGQAEDASDAGRLSALGKRGVSFYVVRDDALERGIALEHVTPHVELIARADVPTLYARHDQVWLW
jgi:hypothetical protein